MEFPVKYIPIQVSYQESAKILKKSDKEEFDRHFKSQWNAALLSINAILVFLATLTMFVFILLISGINFIEIGVLIGAIVSIGITYKIILSREKISKKTWQVYLKDRVELDRRIQLHQVLDLTVLDYIENYNGTS
jgi:hypothetical protein